MGVVQYFCVFSSRLKVSVPHLRQIAPFAVKNSVFVPLVSFCEEISGKTSAPPNFSRLEILRLHTCSISGSKLLRLLCLFAAKNFGSGLQHFPNASPSLTRPLTP